MAICPFAHVELLPQDKTQPKIKPTQHIWHTAVDGQSTTDLYGWFASANAKGAESHFYIAGSGNLIQMMDTEVRADAQFAGNGDGISTETHDGGNPATPWNAAQIATAVSLSRWLQTEHGIPPVLIGSATQPGHGYHAEFHAWNLDSHDCPGSVREAQIPGVLAQVNKPTPPTPSPIPEDLPMVSFVTDPANPKGTWYAVWDGGKWEVSPAAKDLYLGLGRVQMAKDGKQVTPVAQAIIDQVPNNPLPVPGA